MKSVKKILLLLFTLGCKFIMLFIVLFHCYFIINKLSSKILVLRMQFVCNENNSKYFTIHVAKIQLFENVYQ